MQVPDRQASLFVQAFPSSQAVPFALDVLEQRPVDGLHVPGSWHWSWATQTTVLAPLQMPPWQVSVVVQALLSSHAEPFAFGGFEQTPVAGSQVPAAEHGFCAAHVTGLLPVQVPDWHVSLCVQAFPSLQLVPFVAFGFEQVPVDELHVPATWHGSSAAHVTGLLPVQVPDWHVSLCVQAFPSLQLVPFVAFGFEQLPVAGLQLPAAWHWSDATHVTGFDPVQVPDWHVSLAVQAFPSSHPVPFGVAPGDEHVPVFGSQVPGV
jgi:hypothetical protein